MENKNRDSILKIVQELLINENNENLITPTLILQKIELALMLNPNWGINLDKQFIVDELIRRFSIWIGQDTTIADNKGHVPWLSSDRKKDWKYWQRYRQWQDGKLPWTAIEGINNSSDDILGLLEDPVREGAWDRRGLVVGHVQSGKTGNYTGLICKAADAGYKIIIVLAGMHNNLRSQTQMRLDEGFLGYETNPISEDVNIIGVGKVDTDPSIRPNSATNRSDKGDFNTKAAKHLAISPEQRPWLFVVKKNKTVLTRLHKWIEDHVANALEQNTGRKIVTHLPLLVIDDEADNASVDTGEQLHDENNKPDEDHQPKAINSLIRRILHSFQRKSYVGYTATPFANIYIHERNSTHKEGPDLFPSSFIINLAAPSNYIGPAKVFGLNKAGNREGALPLMRYVTDHNCNSEKDGWMPSKHKSDHIPVDPSEFGIPSSLVEAVNSFILSCIIRNLRGQADKHSSMLIHVTRFNLVQQEIFHKVDAYIKLLSQKFIRNIGTESLINEFKALWFKDFIPSSEAIKQSLPELVSSDDIDWEDIENLIPDVISEISVRMINGTAKDALDYADSPVGLKVIAIGGDKLARGLTLEGLCTSYFLRASKMYDTLMQMGRWFGYRHGYLDLCRLYTTADLVEWFEHIADASEELREEFDLMVNSGGTPRDFGLKVQSHSVLMITSRLKMRTAKSLYLSFSGQIIETVSLFKDQAKIAKNYKNFENFYHELGPSQLIPPRNRGGKEEKFNATYWSNVEHDKITVFLDNYETSSNALKANSQLLSEFIKKMAQTGELTNWTVAVINGSKEISPLNEKISYILRTDKSKGTSDSYPIGRLISPRDETIDLNDEQWQAALELTQQIYKSKNEKNRDNIPKVPNGPSIRRVRGFGHNGVKGDPTKALLLIYLLSPTNIGREEGSDPVVSLAVSFPGSNNSKTKVEYKVNNVLWEQEYGPSD